MSTQSRCFSQWGEPSPARLKLGLLTRASNQALSDPPQRHHLNATASHHWRKRHPFKRHFHSYGTLDNENYRFPRSGFVCAAVAGCMAQQQGFLEPALNTHSSICRSVDSGSTTQTIQVDDPLPRQDNANIKPVQDKTVSPIKHVQDNVAFQPDSEE